MKTNLTTSIIEFGSSSVHLSLSNRWARGDCLIRSEIVDCSNFTEQNYRIYEAPNSILHTTSKYIEGINLETMLMPPVSRLPRCTRRLRQRRSEIPTMEQVMHIRDLSWCRTRFVELKICQAKNLLTHCDRYQRTRRYVVWNSLVGEHEGCI